MKGDQISKSIAAASILAKVSRDRWIREVAKDYPNYAFEKHKGYGTKLHWEALKKFGPTPFHRKTFLSRLDRLKQGARGEDLVQDFFTQKKYQIRERNWRKARLELDLVVESSKEIRFIEVRQRTKEVSLDMAFAPKKQMSFKKAVQVYLFQNQAIAKNKNVHLDFFMVHESRIEPYWDVFQL